MMTGKHNCFATTLLSCGKVCGAVDRPKKQIHFSWRVSFVEEQNIPLTDNSQQRHLTLLSEKKQPCGIQRDITIQTRMVMVHESFVTSHTKLQTTSWIESKLLNEWKICHFGMAVAMDEQSCCKCIDHVLPTQWSACCSTNEPHLLGVAKVNQCDSVYFFALGLHLVVTILGSNTCFANTRLSRMGRFTCESYNLPVEQDQQGLCFLVEDIPSDQLNRFIYVSHDMMWVLNCECSISVAYILFGMLLCVLLHCACVPMGTGTKDHWERDG